MKGIIVVDKVPEICGNCKKSGYRNGIPCCNEKGKTIDRLSYKPDWCPIKPLPIGMFGLKKAIEKQTPIEANYEGDSVDENGNIIYDTWICPSCGEKYELDYDDYDYCPNCGQRVTRKEIEV